jgi:uncharacterized protein YnzC (UPF0291/DUF896 family)
MKNNSYAILKKNRTAYITAQEDPEQKIYRQE